MATTTGEIEQTATEVELVVKHETLVEALLYAQMEYPVLTHNQKVEFTPRSGRDVKYSYADLAHTKNTIGPCLHRHGLVINSTLSEDNTHLIMRMRHIHSGEMDVASYEIGTSGDQKEQGGNITWARRYLWCLLTGCVGEEDNGADRVTREEEAGRQGNKERTGQGGQEQEKPKSDKSALNKKKDHASYLSNAYGLPDEQMKEECRRWYNSKHAEEGLVFESRGKFQISDWVGYMAYSNSQLATDHQIDAVTALVENEVSPWKSIEDPIFLTWGEDLLKLAVPLVDISELSREKIHRVIEALHKLGESGETEKEKPASDDESKTWPEKVADMLEAEDLDLYFSCAYRVNIALAPPEVKQSVDDICEKTLSSVKLQKSARESYNAFKKWMEKVGDKQKIWAFLDAIGGLKEETQNAIFNSLGVPKATDHSRKVRSISPALFSQWQGVVEKCVEEGQNSEESPY